MIRIGQKINNSYDSEPSTSTDGSSTEMVLKSPSHTLKFSHLILPPEQQPLFNNRCELSPMKEKTPPRKTGFFRQHTSKGTDISPNNVPTAASVALKPKPLSQSSASTTSIEYGSGEISNQYNRCQTDLRQLNLDFLVNKHLQDITDFTIIPASSDDEVDRNHIDRKSLTDFDHENSCNAVDHTISTETNSTLDECRSTLSFNGKINSIGCQSATANDNDNRTTSGKAVAYQNVVETQDWPHANEQSPDLFAEFEDHHKTDSNAPRTFDAIDDSRSESTMFEGQPTERNAIDKEMMTKIKRTLSASVHPSLTIVQHDLGKLLEMYRDNLPKTCSNDAKVECLFNRQSHKIEAVKEMEWPDVMGVQVHGVCFNRSTYSENIESLYMKFAERNIGAETSSSFTYSCSPSSAKKRAMRMKMLSQSPGSTSRLSHLARRRAIFSSANLLSNSQPATSNPSKLGNTQLVIDTKKTDKRGRYKRKTPKRKTPGKRTTPAKRKTPGRKTPGSERKRNYFKQSKPIAPTRESSKRALFQSPPKEKPKPHIPPEIAQRLEKSKRVLFSPSKTETLKRKREDDVAPSTMGMPSMKIQRTLANVTQRSLKLAKSQSFCIESSNVSSSATSSMTAGKSMFRSSSEQTFISTQRLSHSHRQKLLWAISESLKKKNICASHANFRQYASVLCKVVKRLFLEAIETKTGSTSATLSRISDRVVFWVVQGKSVDDIYLIEKQRLEKTKMINGLPKLNGYIAPDEYAERKDRMRVLSSDCSWDSFGLSQLSATQISNSSQSCDTSQSDYNFVGDLLCSQSTTSSQYKLKTLHESDNENDLPGSMSTATTMAIGNSALRENIDSEQRQKSAQKNLSFSGKNQKNVSPYTDRQPLRTSSCKQQKNSLFVAGGGGGKNANILKAKRQISFDT